jgi:tetratricopeptide (TPR) repeat protein
MRFPFNYRRIAPPLLAVGVALAFLLTGYFWFTRGVCAQARNLMSARDFDKAIALLIEVDPDEDAEEAFLLAVALRRGGRPAEAEEPLRRAAALGWPSAQIELQRCLLVAQSGRVPEAEPRLKEIMLTDVDDESAEQIYEAMSKGYMIAFRLQEAMGCLEYWLEWQPDAPRALLWRAEISRRGQQSKAAIEDYAAVLRLDPSNYEARFEMARTKLATGDVAKAHEELLHCLEISPDDAVVLAALAQSSRRLGELEDSVKYARAALEEQPLAQRSTRTRVDALTELGHAQLALGDIPKAIEAFSQVVEVDSGNLAVHHSLSRAYALLGNEEAAEQAQQDAKKAWTQDTRSFEMLLMLKDEPTNADLRVEMGSILLDQKQIPEAMRWFQSALLVDPNHREAKKYLASVMAGSLPARTQTDATGPSSEESIQDPASP